MKKIFAYFSTAYVLLAYCMVSTGQDRFTIRNETFVLSNGLKVVLHRDSSLPVVAVNMIYRAGSVNDPAGKGGTANIVGSLLSQESSHIPRRRLVKVMDECGGSFGGQVDVDQTNFWSVFPSRFLETALWIESDRLGFGAAAFSRSRLDSMKKYLETARKMQQKRTLASIPELIFAHLYPSDIPYHRTTDGTPKEIAKIGLEDIRKFAADYITPDNASLCIGGDFDPVEVKAMVRKYFEEIPSAQTKRAAAQAPFTFQFKPGFVVNEEKLDFSRLYLVFPTVPAGALEEPALQFIASILTGDRFARLTKSLVLDNRIAIDVQAYQSSQQRAGSFWIEVTCRMEVNLSKIYRAVMSELDDLAKTPVSEEEISSIKNKMTNAFYTAVEKLSGFGGRVDLLNIANLFRNNPDASLDNLIAFRNMNPSALRAACVYLNPDNCLVINAVPKGKSSLAVMSRD